ncbi:type II pantothenate kinase [Bacillus sp. 2205SS5-2]|uniref:type II pantothenate kinase n=1 Tax=Bacillus sp. 2205SS5-2 TaxID=3109031 RepID=UPI003004F913
MKKIAIDAGGTLAKITYKENEHFYYKSFPVAESEQWLSWLNVIARDATYILTGGNAKKFARKLNHVHFVPEFAAMAEGARLLLAEKEERKPPFILVSIGTGTSVFFVDHDDQKRVSGTGIGGGTLMGLGRVLTGGSSFEEIVNLASSGERKNSDLVVADLYAPEIPPISGDLTASNFEKASSYPMSIEDLAAALVNMIGETIVLLANGVAREFNQSTIVFVGSTLTQNQALKEVLSRFETMLNYQAVFLDKGEFAGARGALSLGN